MKISLKMMAMMAIAAGCMMTACSDEGDEPTAQAATSAPSAPPPTTGSTAGQTSTSRTRFTKQVKTKHTYCCGRNHKTDYKEKSAP